MPSANLSENVPQLSESRLSLRREIVYAFPVKEMRMMTIHVRELVLAGEAALFAVTALVTAVRLREPRGKNETSNLSPLAVLFLVAGGLFILPTFAGEKGVYFAFLAVPAMYAALAAANMRLQWDAEGFTYRTVLGRACAYRYEDVRRIRRFGGRYGSDLFIRVKGRLIALDAWMNWEPFIGAYDNWWTRHGQPSWREQERAAWLERYRRHGDFGRKLDRISGGRAMLAGSIAVGLVLAGLAAICLRAPVRPGQELLQRAFSAVLLLAGAGFPLLYVWAVAHMNKRVLHCYVRGRIRPDPLSPAKPKRYRRKR